MNETFNQVIISLKKIKNDFTVTFTIFQKWLIK